MDYDHKEMLTLLAGHRSEEARRAHRNLTVTSFIVISAKLIGIRLTKVSAFGITPFDGSERVVLSIVMVLLSYWLALFLAHWSRDREIQKERALLLEQYMKPILERHAHMKKKLEAKQNVAPDWSDIKRTVMAYQAQQERTRKAAKLSKFTEIAEIAVPLVLAALALAALGHWFFVLH
jgi:hypothetical protein